MRRAHRPAARSSRRPGRSAPAPRIRDRPRVARIRAPARVPCGRQPVALREMQVAAQVVDARALAVEAAARGQFLRAVQRRERRLHGAGHPMRRGDADLRGAALAIVAGQRQARARTRRSTLGASPMSRAELAFELRERMAHRTGRVEFARRAAAGAARRRCAARPPRRAPPRGTPPPRADRRRDRGARHAASRRAPRYQSAARRCKCAPRAVQQRRVRAVADQRMREHPAARRPPLRAHEVARDQRRAVVGGVAAAGAQHGEIEALAEDRRRLQRRLVRRRAAGRAAPARRSGSMPGIASPSAPLRSSCVRNSGLPCARSTQRCATSGLAVRNVRAERQRVRGGERRQIEADRRGIRATPA